MGKKELKSKIYEAMESGPLRESIEKLSLFGSHAKEEATPESDIDLLIEFSPDAVISFFMLSELKEYMEKKLGKNVDILTPDSISRYLKESILKEADIIYER